MDRILLRMNSIVGCCRLANDPASGVDERRKNTRIQLRRSTASDANSILQLVHGLASYEKASHEVSVTPSTYVRDDDLFQCILIEVMTEDPEKNRSSKVSEWDFFIWAMLYRRESIFTSKICSSNLNIVVSGV